jgi:hypothetical protein
VELYFHSPIHLHEVIIKHMDNFTFFSFNFSTVKMNPVRSFDMWRTILPDYTVSRYISTLLFCDEIFSLAAIINSGIIVYR